MHMYSDSYGKSLDYVDPNMQECRDNVMNDIIVCS